jgi:ferredoxin, 2Fe-2S
MPNLIVITPGGIEHEIKADAALSIMENMRNNAIDGLLALCGGCCSCATCHVIIDPKFVDRLPPMSENENDLLDSSDARTATSRLSCQVPMTDELDGIRVTIAKES